MVFPAACEAGRLHPGEALHPAQIYSSLGGFLIWGLLLLWERRDRRVGGTFGRFLILYGLSRTVVDLFRDYEPSAVHALGLTTSQLISAALILAGLVVLARRGEDRHG